MPLVDGKACFALTLINKGSREIILASALLLASLAILAPLASAQQCGYNGGAVVCIKEGNPSCGQESLLGNEPGEDAKNAASFERLQPSKPADFNRDIYYRNKLEFSVDGGWLPINIPFPLDVFVGDAYNTYPLNTRSYPSLHLCDGIWTT